MVRNGNGSLRGSASNMSLFSTRIEDENTAATQARLADLEAQIKELKDRESAEKEMPKLPSLKSISMQNLGSQFPASHTPQPDNRGDENTLFDTFMEYRRPNGILVRRDFPLGVEEGYPAKREREQQQPRRSLITKALGGGSQLKSPEAYAQPFCDFLTDNPTVFHAVDYFEKKLDAAGFKKVHLLPTLSSLCLHLLAI